MRLGWTRSIKLLSVALVLLLALWLILAPPWHRSYPSRWQGPWFGRAANMSPCRHRVLVGPVEAGRGIRGVLELGMTRSQVIAHLGEPLAPAIPQDQAGKLGFYEMDAPADEFFDGVFAWVQYDARNRVSGLSFLLSAFSEKLKGKQDVALAVDGKTYILTRDLTQARAQAMFRRGGVKRIEVGRDLLRLNAAVGLGFHPDLKPGNGPLDEVSLWVPAGVRRQ